jgi:N-acetylmuramoyl-L-alanine amidase
MHNKNTHRTLQSRKSLGPTYYHRRSALYVHKNEQKPKHSLRSFVIIVGLVVAGAAFINARSTTHAITNVPIKPTYAHIETVCLDPGHGGIDPGALSTDGTINERDINLVVANKVMQNLNKAGYQVYTTRTTNDVTMDNHDRYSYCNNLHSSILVSIHHNYFTDSTVDYDTTLFYKDSDQALATSIVADTSAELQITNNGIAKFNDGVLSESSMPAAVSEGYFITNDAELTLMSAVGSTRLSDEADGITKGITGYFALTDVAKSATTSNTSIIDRSDP